MGQISVNDKMHIKQLLCDNYIVGVRNASCCAFGGFELWWYDREQGICLCRRSRWSDFRQQIEEHSLEHAASFLWHNRGTLFLRHKVPSSDQTSEPLPQSNN